jgi:hypothetical protein
MAERPPPGAHSTRAYNEIYMKLGKIFSINKMCFPYEIRLIHFVFTPKSQRCQFLITPRVSTAAIPMAFNCTYKAEEVRNQHPLCKPIPGLGLDKFGEPQKLQHASHTVLPSKSSLSFPLVPTQASASWILTFFLSL